MNLIDAYVSEVGRHLPEKTSGDIQNELRSMIEDTLEDESKKQGRPVDEEMQVEALKGLGSPEKMAASYQPPRYLIGPDLYPSFILTLRVVLSVILALGVAGLGISVGLINGLPTNLLKAAAQAASGMINALFQAAGVITLVFALLQRLVPSFKPYEKNWDPRKLAKIKPTTDQDRINPPGIVVEIVLTIVALSLFNFFPQDIGIVSNQNGQWVVVPVLTQAFLQFIPWFSILWSAEAVLKITLLAKGSWNLALRLASIVLSVLSIALIYRILTSVMIVAFPADMISRLGMGSATPDFISQLSAITNGCISLGLAVALIAETVEVAKKVYRLVIQARMPARMEGN